MYDSTKVCATHISVVDQYPGSHAMRKLPDDVISVAHTGGVRFERIYSLNKFNMVSCIMGLVECSTRKKK